MYIVFEVYYLFNKFLEITHILLLVWKMIVELYHDKISFKFFAYLCTDFTNIILSMRIAKDILILILFFLLNWFSRKTFLDCSIALCSHTPGYRQVLNWMEIAHKIKNFSNVTDFRYLV